MTAEQLNVCLAVAALLVAAAAFVVAMNTLEYMRGRDLELDLRNGWIEIHKAMVELRVRRELIMLQNKMAQYGAPSPVNPASVIADYTLAAAQLRAQLDRLNDDPLIIELAEFLDENKLTAQWQQEKFLTAFDAFVHKVALKARPA